MSTTVIRRRQLTLFAQEPWRAPLDALRRRLDPVQAELIGAHVTLCREDEIADLDAASLLGRVRSWTEGPILLGFGPPTRFNGHGVLLPCVKGAEQFHRLRQWLLQKPDARVHDAHLTLAHPRNPRDAGNTDAAFPDCPQALRLALPVLTLIEQHGSAPWRPLAESRLGVVHDGG